MNILEKIVAYKKLEVEAAKKATPQSALEKLPQFNVPAYSLKRFLLDSSRTGIIAEFKRQSPSKGIINNTSSVQEVTSAYAANGAAGLSVLTDGPSFGGSIDDLIAARMAPLPILRKEFVVDEYQLWEAKAYGADAVLFIAAILTNEQVHSFSLTAMELGLEVILEVHDEQELEKSSDAIDIIGVNNRNLKTFEVDIEQSARLASLIPHDKLKISESGLHDVRSLNYLKSLGYNGFLMGEAFMREADPGLAFMKFVDSLNSAQL